MTDVVERWRAAWPDALALWSRFTKLREPHWCFTAAEEKEQQLTGSFAMIRLTDHTVVISVRQISQLGLEDYPREIMGHEIGHHVYCPADLTDAAKLMARIRAALPTREQHASLVSNLYTDLLINDRLTRFEELRMSDVYRKLSAAADNRLWTLYMRICEVLWSLERGTLAHGKIDDGLNGDAILGARVIRAYASDWLRGAGRFAALFFDYLGDDAENEKLRQWLDTRGTAEEGLPEGLSEIDDDEIDGAIHPSLDPDISGVPVPAHADVPGDGVARKRYREPFQYSDLLRSLGVKLSDDEIVARYYRERAAPHLIPFPQRELPHSVEPLPEALEPWDAGDALEELDVVESVMNGDRIVPGITALKRVWGTTEGRERRRDPLDLYVGIDCSGSMGNPQQQTSWPVLAGTIVALSALRAGARVKVVLSGEPGRYVTMADFSRDEKEILRTLTSYLGTGFTFGIHRLAETFDARKDDARPVHVLIVSDHDLFAMLARVEQGRLGWDVARAALQKARGGGTYVLNMPLSFEPEKTQRMRDDGWTVASIQQWEDIVAFARDFSRRTFA